MTTNPFKIGEFQKFYYQAGDFDTTQTEDLILADANWLELCIVNLDIGQTFTEHIFNDTCNADVETVAPGRRQITLSFDLNLLRIDIADIRAWQAAIAGRDIVGVLALTGDRTDPDEFGFVGNFVYTGADETRPVEGAIVDSYTLRPSAKSAFDPIYKEVYGANVA